MIQKSPEENYADFIEYIADAQQLKIFHIFLTNKESIGEFLTDEGATIDDLNTDPNNLEFPDIEEDLEE